LESRNKLNYIDTEIYIVTKIFFKIIFK
jgi:hypothetical protein